MTFCTSVFCGSLLAELLAAAFPARLLSEWQVPSSPRHRNKIIKALSTGQTSLRMFTEVRDEVKCLRETLFVGRPTQQCSSRSCGRGGEEGVSPVPQWPVPGLS